MRRDDRRWLWLPFIGVDEYYPRAVRVEMLEASLNLEECLHTRTIISGKIRSLKINKYRFKER